MFDQSSSWIKKYIAERFGRSAFVNFKCIHFVCRFLLFKYNNKKWFNPEFRKEL